MVKGFHSNWTRPFFTLNKDKEYFIEDFEILTTILSALKWREFNGSIKMITDIQGAEYYKKLGIEDIWDLGIDTVLENIPQSINPNVFWAAGKIYAMNYEKTPFAMIDTDFIVWSSVETLFKNKELCVNDGLVNEKDCNDIIRQVQEIFEEKFSDKCSFEK